MSQFLGGFLAGFGACLLIISIMGIYGSVTSYYGTLGWADDVERIYNLSHSEPYKRALSIMKNISSVFEGIRDIIRLIGGNQSQIQYIEEIPRASSYMEDIQKASENAKRGMQILSILPPIFAALTTLSLVLIIIGARISKRAQS